MKQEEITTKSALEIISKQTSLFIFTSLAPFIVQNPIWAIPFALGAVMINTWGDFGSKRTEELLDFIIAHKEEFVSEVLDSDKFKSVFLNVLERHMKEVNEHKRQLFRTYLLNVGKGIEPDFNYHTKIMSILDQITFKELGILSIWDGQLQKKLIEKNNKIGYNNDNIAEKMKGLNEHQVMFAFEGKQDKPTMDELTFILRSLGNYGILSTRESSGVIVGDGSDGIRVKEITDFGIIFLKFIKED